MSNIVNKITALSAVVFIGAVSVLTVFLPKQSHSQDEGRELAKFPEISMSALADGSFTESLSTWCADHFAGRSGWTSAGAALNSRICENVSNGIYITGERLLDTDAAKRGSSSAAADSVNDFAENYSGAVYMAAVPTATGVYGNLLPEHLRSDTEKAQISRFCDHISTGVRRIDTYTLLKTLSDQSIYYNTDSRWTCYGAYCVYRTVIQKLGFIPISYGRYSISHVTDEYLGDLYRRAMCKRCRSDILDVYTISDGAEITECTGMDNQGIVTEKQLFDREAAKGQEKYQLYLGEPLPLIRISTTVSNERKLLVIGDSFADCFIPFLTQHYSEIVYFRPKYAARQLTSFLDPDDYEQTLLLMGIDTLSEGSIPTIEKR
jgi:hypothetical protein